MFEQYPKEEILFIIQELESAPLTTQRSISSKLAISLGKVNYILKKLIKEGFIETKNNSNGNSKPRQLAYVLTEKGIEEKMRLMHYFLKKKEEDYKRIKFELEHLGNNQKEFRFG